MAPKDKQIKKKVVTHKPKLAHKLAKYVRAYPVHLSQGEGLPSISHLGNSLLLSSSRWSRQSKGLQQGKDLVSR